MRFIYLRFTASFLENTPRCTCTLLKIIANNYIPNVVIDLLFKTKNTFDRVLNVK